MVSACAQAGVCHVNLTWAKQCQVKQMCNEFRTGGRRQFKIRNALSILRCRLRRGENAAGEDRPRDLRIARPTRKPTLRLPPYQQSALTGSIDLWSREKTQQMLIEVEIVPLFAGANLLGSFACQLLVVASHKGFMPRASPNVLKRICCCCVLT